nr:PepSY domain-containing protein [uncultured Leptotrichia sp.]
MKNIRKRGCFNYTITLMILLLSINFLVKGNNIEKGDVKLSPKVNIKTSDTQITPNKAKSIALGHAGVSEAAANFKKIKLDNKNGRAAYEIEFIANNSRYEFSIDAGNGSVIKFEKR